MLHNYHMFNDTVYTMYMHDLCRSGKYVSLCAWVKCSYTLTLGKEWLKYGHLNFGFGSTSWVTSCHYIVDLVPQRSPLWLFMCLATSHISLLLLTSRQESWMNREWSERTSIRSFLRGCFSMSPCHCGSRTLQIRVVGWAAEVTTLESPIIRAGPEYVKW